MYTRFDFILKLISNLIFFRFKVVPAKSTPKPQSEVVEDSIQHIRTANAFQIAPTEAFVVILENNTKIAVKMDWVETPILNSVSKIFFSPNPNDEPNFKMPKFFYFYNDIVACYTGHVAKKFGETTDAT